MFVKHHPISSMPFVVHRTFSACV